MSDKKKSCQRAFKKACSKVSLCCALLINPKMVMFDEPMIGLDPKAIKELKEILWNLKTQVGNTYSTHMIDSIAEIWDKVLL